MAVEHRIRKNGKGDTYLIKLTALRAIRKHCLECVCFSPDEVKLCTEQLCPLYPFRFGKVPGGIRRKKRVPKEGIEALRKYRESLSTQGNDTRDSTIE